ncbi:hypothetical protein PVK06_021086 [Gossypium arboreum]|uniref:Uncharacterized protein n=1 Tax=Gossypium arboreum TaxID=29729 RepID=A0ABR0PP22_GOSAR|nr:hypothetical protein PVK06_021086 [Gossypium arboreum]
MNDFAANLDDEVAAQFARHPKAVSLFLNNGRKLHRTHNTILGFPGLGSQQCHSIQLKSGTKPATVKTPPSETLTLVSYILAFHILTDLVIVTT